MTNIEGLMSPTSGRSLRRVNWMDEVRRRRMRASMVRERFADYHPGLSVDEQQRVLRLRCERRHEARGARRPIIARVYLSREGYLFASRIEWLAGDFHEMP